MNKLLISLLLFTSGCACNGAVGIMYGHSTGRIDYALSGTEAEKWDLQPGDILLNPEELKGKPGKEVIVKILRGTQVLEFKTKLVCIDAILNKVW